ncbi:PAS domain S-box-containing protein [Onishia taeanensis]|uniref:PAS domain S-box-containing protein n=1 Tax=Onishia taeanensis TaxID=284577 RepID=A0A1G7N0P0_9GAMM|nr:PAS domain S-box protein [Halomonas taeanensis]SDF66909.1 PAS domain S-box-containing protein [Halomonas taeanensis]
MKRPPMISSELLERIIDASEDGIVVAEREGDEHILIYVNQGFERMTGYSTDEILYRDCRFLQNDDRDQPGLARIREALVDNRPCREILRNYKKDGTLFYNELSITPMYDEREDITYYLGVQKDVTERVEAIAELERIRGTATD